MTCVLVIDDDAGVRASLQLFLEIAGYRVLSARDGLEGIREFQARRPDIVITDILMPEQEGMETIVQLRALAPEVPIVAISGGGRFGEADVLAMAQSLGANAVLPKPFDAEMLLAAIERLVPGD
jgi:DNA-binding response OmpR family regulator